MLSNIFLVIPVLFLLGIVGMVLLVLVYGYASARSRSKILQAKAEELGFHYQSYNLASHILPWVGQGRKAEELLASPIEFPFFALGEPYRRQVYNLIAGKYLGIDFLLFDHLWYGVGGAKPRSGKGARQTVLRLELPQERVLPGFCLRPGAKPIFYNFLPGFQVIPIHSRHALAARYWLQGDDAQGVVEIFNDRVFEWLAQANWLSVEGRGKYLLLYRRPHLLAADQMEEFLQQGIQLMGLVTDQLNAS